MTALAAPHPRGPRILITGMSGTGKTTLVRALLAHGRTAHDLDTPEWSEWVEAVDPLTPAPGRDWVWRVDRVRNLLAAPDAETMFVSGCAENMAQLYPLIDTIILLSAPVQTIMARLLARSAEQYGSTAEERRKVALLIASIEPRLRAAASHEIDTRGPVAETVERVLLVASKVRLPASPG